MYNQWALQQVAAVQFAALQQQQLQQRFLAQHAMTINSPPAAQVVSDGDDSDDEEDEQKRTLFCANLDDRVTEELLYEVFLQAGPIESVRIPKDNTGRQRTFGFVTYLHSCSASYAMHLYQGLALFRKSLTIKFQGNSSAPPTPQHQRRSLPNDCEAYKRRSGGSGGNNYDNSSLRSSNYAAFNDLNSANANPFKRDERTDRSKGRSNETERMDRSKGRSNETERVSKHASGQTRAHQNTAPYQRRSGGSDGNDRGHERHGNDYQRRHQHSGSNRRSEQRNNNRR